MLHVSFAVETFLLFHSAWDIHEMVDLQDEDDVVYFSPAEPVRPLKRNKQQQVDIIDLSSPTKADGEAVWEASSCSKESQAAVWEFPCCACIAQHAASSPVSDWSQLARVFGALMPTALSCLCVPNHNTFAAPLCLCRTCTSCKAGPACN